MTSTKPLSVAFTITLLTLTTTLLDVKASGSDPSIKHSSRDFRNSLDNLFDGLVRKRHALSKREDTDIEGFSDYEKEDMLLLHNSYRSVVEPTAANMIEITWDDGLEEFAQGLVNQCKDLGDWAGTEAILYRWTGGDYDMKGAVERWFNGRNDYNFDTQACQNPKSCGRYLTIAWSKTQKIGCGFKRCQRFGSSRRKRVVFNSACSYSARSLNNTRPYEKGPACSKCPDEFPKCRYNLCVSQASFDDCQGYNGTLTMVGVERPSTHSDAMKCSGFVPVPGNDDGDGGDDGDDGEGGKSGDDGGDDDDGGDGGKSGDGGDDGDDGGDGGKSGDGGDDGDDGGDGGKSGDGGVDRSGDAGSGGGDNADGCGGRGRAGGSDDGDDSGASLTASLFAILTTTVLSVTIITTSARLYTD